MSLLTLSVSLLASALSLSAVIPVASASSFSDVPSTHANAEAIAYVKAQGIVSGNPDGTFRPNQTINRAEFTKIILEATQERASCASASKTFSDVPRDAWYAVYVCRGKELGVIGGYPDGTFRPGSAINFAEAAKIIAQAQGYSVTADAAVWYRGSVEALGERKAIPVSIDSFEKKLTRGEMAEMIWRLKAEITTKPSETYEELAASDGWATTTNQQLGIRFEHPANATVSSVEQRKTTDGTTINELTVTPTGMDPTRVHFFSTHASFDQAKNIQILWNYQNQESEFGNNIIDGRAGTRRIDHSPNNDCTHEVTVVEKSGVVYGFHIIQCPSHPEGYDQLRRDIANSLELL